MERELQARQFRQQPIQQLQCNYRGLSPVIRSLSLSVNNSEEAGQMESHISSFLGHVKAPNWKGTATTFKGNRT